MGCEMVNLNDRRRIFHNPGDFILTTVVFFMGVLLLSLANGANDNFKGMATLWGGGILSYRKALILANIATLAGGCAAFVLGAGLLSTFSGKGIVSTEVLQSPQFVASFAIGAALTVICATWLKYPISTTHSILGSLAGAAFALPLANPLYGVLVQKAFLPLLLSPLIALGLTYVLWQIRCLVVGRFATATSSEGGSASLQTVGASNDNGTASEGNFFERSGHIASGFTVCFARGVNDTPKIASIWLLGSTFDLSTFSIFVAIAVLMVVGSLMFSFNVAKVMSKEITGMSESQGFVGNFVTALLVLFASKLGLGVSTTHVSVGSLFGIGMVSGKAHWGKIQEILLSWVLTLPIGFGFAALSVTIFEALL